MSKRKIKRNAIIATLSMGNLLCLLLLPHVPLAGVIACTAAGFWIHTFSTLMDFPVYTPTGQEPPPSDSEPWRHSDSGR